GESRLPKRRQPAGVKARELERLKLRGAPNRLWKTELSEIVACRKRPRVGEATPETVADVQQQPGIERDGLIDGRTPVPVVAWPGAAGGGDIAEEVDGHALGPLRRAANENAPVRKNVVVDARVELVEVAHSRSGGRIVIGLGEHVCR